MSKKTEYIYNENGNIPFTDKDKERLDSNPNNYKFIYDDITKQKIKAIINNDTLININNYKAKNNKHYKKIFNDADYISYTDLIKIISYKEQEKENLKNKLDYLENQIKEIEKNNSNNYDITKFNTNNDIIAKVDPIAKDILSGKNYEIGKLIKANNNYNDKNYGAVFSIKTADLSNIDIIQELQQKGIKITHFGKKVIDDIDILLDENKGNINNNNNLVALTPKMIAKKVYNVKQPTKKQTQEIINELKHYSNIYLFFVKDDKTASDVEKLVQLKDRGLEYLQDAEGNVLNIGDALDDNLILNAKYGVSKKYNSEVYVFDNKSIFDKINQIINNDVGKQLKLGLKDKSNEIFNDYNKNVSKDIVGIRYFLFERVNQIKHSLENKQKTNKEVLLSTIYNEYNITTPKQKTAIRKAIKNTLNYWVDINYIISYEFLDKEGNKIPNNSTKEIYKIFLNVNTITSENIN